MNKKFLLLPLFFLTLCFVACDETEEPGRYDNWQARNIAFNDSLQRVVDANPNGDLKFVKDSRDQRINIFYKVIEPGDASQLRPMYSGTVNIYFRGMLIDEAVFGTSNNGYYTELWEDLIVFKPGFGGDDPDPRFDTPERQVVSTTSITWTSGLREIVQWMHPGARWEVYVPFQSGYGTELSNGIPGYSTLLYDLTLVSVEEQ